MIPGSFFRASRLVYEERSHRVSKIMRTGEQMLPTRCASVPLNGCDGERTELKNYQRKQPELRPDSSGTERVEEFGALGVRCDVPGNVAGLSRRTSPMLASEGEGALGSSPRDAATRKSGDAGARRAVPSWQTKYHHAPRPTYVLGGPHGGAVQRGIQLGELLSRARRSSSKALGKLVGGAV